MESQRVEYIRQLWSDFDVKVVDMKQPTTEFVLRFLEKVLEDLALLEFAFEDRHSDQVLNQLSIVDASRKIIICTIFRHIFSKIKGPQFGIEDIIEPDPKRFGKQVDILMNLIRYLEVHFAKTFNSTMEEMDLLSKCRDDYIREIDALAERRNQIAIEKKALFSQLNSGEKAKYTAILSKVKGKTMELTTEYDKLKGIYQKQAVDMSALEEAIQMESERIEDLKKNIILSPDAVSREKVELMSRKVELEDNLSAIKNTADEKNHFVSQLEQLCSTMETVPGEVKDLAEKQIFFKNMEMGFHEDEVKYKKGKDKYEAIVKEYESTKQESSNIKKELVKLKEEHTLKCASLENDLLKANRNLQETEEEHIKKEAEQVLAFQEIHVWKDKITAIDEKEKLFEKNFLDQKQQIENEVDFFYQRIEQKVERMEKQLRKPPH